MIRCWKDWGLIVRASIEVPLPTGHDGGTLGVDDVVIWEAVFNPGLEPVRLVRKLRVLRDMLADDGIHKVRADLKVPPPPILARHPATDTIQ